MGASRRRGNVPNIVNTPSGPREREERPRMPVTRPRDISYKVPDRERREEKERQETSGDSFERSRDRRMAGDRTGFFGRVKKMQGGGFFGGGLAMPTGRPTRGDRPGEDYLLVDQLLIQEIVVLVKRQEKYLKQCVTEVLDIL